jgi:hypothetical protein
MIFKGTKDLPSLEFIEDEGYIKIWGRAIATEARLDFWQPLIDKMEDYLKTPRDIVLHLELEFFSTPSAKAILDLLKLIEKKVVKNERILTIKWFSDEDEDSREAGEDFASMIPHANWEIIN